MLETKIMMKRLYANSYFKLTFPKINHFLFNLERKK